MLRVQDDKLDQLHGQIQNIKYGQQNIGKEVDQQNILLDNLEDEVDSTSANLIVIDNKLKSLIAHTGACCLWVIIIIEIIAIVLIALFA